MMIVLTPTGGRPACIKLLAKYLNNQTMPEFTWLIVDDCDPAAPVPQMREGITVDVLRTDWRWQPGMNTLGDSVAFALESASSDMWAIAEDDDVYLPDHLETISAALDGCDLVGQRVSRYYNIQTRRYREIPGQRHASLCSTGFTRSKESLVREVCRHPDCQHKDVSIWHASQGKLLDTETVVGIKGMPGRPGIGIGHRPDFGTPDPDGSVLRSWIGGYAPEYRWHRRK